MRRITLVSLVLAAGCGKDDPIGTDPATGGTTGASTGSTSTTGTPGGDTTSVPTYPVPEGWYRVDVDGGALAATVDAAIGDDGTLYASWAVMGADNDVYVARSADGGATWESPVKVDGPGVDPLIAAGRQPYVHAGPDALWVTFTTDRPDVRLYRSDLDTLAFVEQPVDIGNPTFVDYAKVATTPSGEAWVTWIEYAATPVPQLARESTGFAKQDAGNFPDSPCECCRNDLQFLDSGAAILAFRGNDGALRDIWSIRAPAGATSFPESVQVGHTGWMSMVCPMQGPRVAQLDDGTVLATWADPTAGPWQVWVARSTDDGQSWSGDARLAPMVPGEQKSPALAADGATAWLTLVGDDGYHLLESNDGATAFTELEPLNAGATNIEEPQVEARGGIALVIGANAAGEVVTRRLR